MLLSSSPVVEPAHAFLTMWLTELLRCDHTPPRDRSIHAELSDPVTRIALSLCRAKSEPMASWPRKLHDSDGARNAFPRSSRVAGPGDGLGAGGVLGADSGGLALGGGGGGALGEDLPDLAMTLTVHGGPPGLPG